MILAMITSSIFSISAVLYHILGVLDTQPLLLFDVLSLLILDLLFFHDDEHPYSILCIDRVERRAHVADVFLYLFDVLVKHVLLLQT